MLRNRRVLIVLTLAALVLFRCAIVLTWHKPAGDGIQYYSIAQELRRDHRFAFGPSPTPLSYSRLPGYPLFAAYVAAPWRNVSLEAHLRAATLWNVLFDCLTALFVLLTTRQMGMPRSWSWAAGLCILLWPTLWLMSTFALTESISTLAMAAQMYLAVRISREGRLSWALLAGVIAGLAQLIRFDAVCALPMVIYACWIAPGPPRRRALSSLGYVALAALLFSPWPIRNYLRFGEAHVAATTWRTVGGKPIPDGPVWWARTWSDSAFGDSYFELYFVYGSPIQIERPGIITPKLYDDEAERKQLVQAYGDYNRYGLTDAVNREFLALAHARFVRHPWRTLVTLPLMRVAHLFVGEPEYEMPMQVRWLGLPPLRPLFGILDGLVCLLALLGCLLGRRTPHARLVPLLAVPIVARFIVYAFAIPQATTQRYLVEAFPLILVLGLIGVAAARGLRRATPTPTPPRS